MVASSKSKKAPNLDPKSLNKGSSHACRGIPKTFSHTFLLKTNLSGDHLLALLNVAFH